MVCAVQFCGLVLNFMRLMGLMQFAVLIICNFITAQKQSAVLCGSVLSLMQFVVLNLWGLCSSVLYFMQLMGCMQFASLKICNFITAQNQSAVSFGSVLSFMQLAVLDLCGLCSSVLRFGFELYAAYGVDAVCSFDNLQLYNSTKPKCGFIWFGFELNAVCGFELMWTVQFSFVVWFWTLCGLWG